MRRFSRTQQTGQARQSVSGPLDDLHAHEIFSNHVRAAGNRRQMESVQAIGMTRVPSLSTKEVCTTGLLNIVREPEVQDHAVCKPAHVPR